MTEQTNDEIVMKLLHYFITEKGYSPIVLHGAKNEIWLENFSSNYGIVRIVTNNIYNNEQFDFDVFKTKKIVKKIKQKTFSLNIDTLSIFLNLGDNVNMEKYYNLPKIDCVDIEKIEDLGKFEVIKESFPDILDNTNFKEEGLELFVKLTQEIADVNEDNNTKAEDIFKVKKPIVTYILIAINIILFLAMYLFGNGSTNVATLIDFGANYPPFIKIGEYYRLITAGFLHIGILHLFFNMYALYVVGSQLENFIGKVKYIIVYLGSMIIGNLMSMLFIGNNVSAGASGAIFGLFGALLYFGYHYRVYLGTMVTSQIIPVLVMNFFLGFILSGIDMASHIGGLIGGALILWALGVKYKSEKSDIINGCILLSMLIIFLVLLGFNII